MNACRALRGRSYLWAALLASLLPYAGSAQDAGSARVAAPQESRGTDAAGAGSAKSTVIYVVRRGWHIDVGFAAADIQPPLNSVAGQFPGVQYLFFGFGDRHYLLAKDRNASVSLGALWPRPSAGQTAHAQNRGCHLRGVFLTTNGAGLPRRGPARQ